LTTLCGQKTDNVVGAAGTPELAPYLSTLGFTVRSASFLHHPKDFKMSYKDYLFAAVDSDLPIELWANVIVNESSALAGLDSDLIGNAAWG